MFYAYFFFLEVNTQSKLYRPHVLAYTLLIALLECLIISIMNNQTRRDIVHNLLCVGWKLSCMSRQ